MDAKPFHGAIAARNTAVGHCPHHVMQGFGLQRHVIPEGVVRALPLRDRPVWLWFYRMNKIGELVCVLNEKDRRVVTHQIKNTLFGIKLGRKATNIAHRIGRPSAALHRGEAYKHRSDFLRVREERGFGDIAQIFVRLEIAVRSRTAGVNDTLRDTLMVKMGDLLTQDEIFEQGRTAGPGAQRVLIVSDAHPLIGGERTVFAAFAYGLQRVQLFIAGMRCLQAAGCRWLLARRGRNRAGEVGTIVGSQ